MIKTRSFPFAFQLFGEYAHWNVLFSLLTDSRSRDCVHTLQTSSLSSGVDFSAMNYNTYKVCSLSAFTSSSGLPVAFSGWGLRYTWDTKSIFVVQKILLYKYWCYNGNLRVYQILHELGLHGAIKLSDKLTLNLNSHYFYKKHIYIESISSGNVRLESKASIILPRTPITLIITWSSIFTTMSSY